MWAEAIFTKDDLNEVAAQLFPLRIALGNDGHVLLSEHRELSLQPGVGLRMTISAEIGWPVLGVEVPVSVRAATLEVRPEIVETPGGDMLAFKLHLEGIDVSVLPEFIDRGVVDLVNSELEAKHVELSWGFTRTLSHVFDLPDALLTTGALDLRAVSGRVKVTSEALALAVLFRASVEPRTAKPVSRIDGAPLPVPRRAEAPRPRSPALPSPVVRGVLGALALAVGGGLVALFARGRRRRTFLDHLRAIAS